MQTAAAPLGLENPVYCARFLLVAPFRNREGTFCTPKHPRNPRPESLACCLESSQALLNFHFASATQRHWSTTPIHFRQSLTGALRLPTLLSWLFKTSAFLDLGMASPKGSLLVCLPVRAYAGYHRGRCCPSPHIQGEEVIIRLMRENDLLCVRYRWSTPLLREKHCASSRGLQDSHNYGDENPFEAPDIVESLRGPDLSRNVENTRILKPETLVPSAHRPLLTMTS